LQNQFERFDKNQDGKMTFKELFPILLADLIEKGIVIENTGSPKKGAHIELQSQMTDKSGF
jgi:Ca2+-binding EF-hand superfamily protein